MVVQGRKQSVGVPEENIGNTNTNENNSATRTNSNKGVFSSVFATYAHAMTIRPISTAIIKDSWFVFIFYTLILYIFYTLAYFLSIKFMTFGKDVEFSYGKIAWFSAAMFGVFIVSVFCAAMLFTLWSHKRFSAFTMIVFASTCSWSPLVVLLRFVPVAGYIISFFFVIVMSYYCNSSLDTIYTPRDQREAIIQSALSFMAALGLFTVLQV